MTCLTQRERSLLWPSISFFLPFLLLWAVGLCGGCRPAEAFEIPDSLAIRAILGESRGEGYRGMYAIACAIRNRGSLKGVYGLTAKMEPISGALYQKASKAWHESEDGPDITNGAKHWDGSAFPKPHWAGTVLAIIGNQVFYAVIGK